MTEVQQPWQLAARRNCLTARDAVVIGTPVYFDTMTSMVFL
jgi:hypothetical protein